MSEVNNGSEVTTEEKTPANNVIDSGMNRSHKLSNKFAIGDEVWAVVALGPDLKVGKYPVMGMNAENIGDGFKYMYHLPISNDGHADSINMTIVDEDLMYFDRSDAEKRAVRTVNELQNEYKKKIEEITADYEKDMKESEDEFERRIGILTEEMEKINATDLVIQPRIVEKADEPVEPAKKAVVDNIVDTEWSPTPEAVETDSDPADTTPETPQDPTEQPEPTETPEGDCLICGQNTCICPKDEAVNEPNDEPINQPSDEPTSEQPAGEPAKEEAGSQEGEDINGEPSPDSEQPA